MKITENLTEVKKEVYNNEAVLVGISSRSNASRDLMTELLRKLEALFSGRIMAIMALLEENVKSAVILYYRGEEVLRQTAFLGDLSKDIRLMEWSIKEVLSSYRKFYPRSS